MPTARRCIRTSRNSNATAWTSSPCRKAARGTIIWEAVILNYRKSSSSSIPCRHPNSSTSTNRTPLSASSEKLVSHYEGQELQRQVYIFGRIKTSNKRTYLTIDTIFKAINENYQIQFHYCKWNIHKELEKRRDGSSYTVSPWCLVWDNENYYLLGYDALDKSSSTIAWTR